MKKITLLLIAFSLLSSCHVGRFFVWNFADIKDHKKFPSLPIKNDAGKPFKFEETQTPLDLSKAKLVIKNKDYSFEKGLVKEGTVAFLVIRNDTILYEKYFSNYDSSSVVPSFSVAKSFTSALVGFAIADGFIGSVDDTITKYIPTLPAKPYGKITLRHLLDMRSGLEFNENYFNPFGHVAKSYYGTNLKKFSAELKANKAPDADFDYISVNTQLLGWVVQNATGKQLSVYLEEKIWKPLGMEFPASWSIDSKKHKSEKAFCCLNAPARDFAKFGRLYLNNGNWNGEQLLPAEWVEASLDFDKTRFYSFQWWRRPRQEKEQSDFYANGFLGQYIYVNPKKNLIIVRLGKKDGNIYWPKIFQELSDLM